MKIKKESLKNAKELIESLEKNNYIIVNDRDRAIKGTSLEFRLKNVELRDKLNKDFFKKLENRYLRLTENKTDLISEAAPKLIEDLRDLKTIKILKFKKAVKYLKVTLRHFIFVDTKLYPPTVFNSLNVIYDIINNLNNSNFTDLDNEVLLLSDIKKAYENNDHFNGSK